MSKQDAARSILDNPLFDEIMDDLERSAVDRCAYAKPHEHDARLAAAADIRAVRNFKASLEAMANGQPDDPEDVPA